MNLTTKINMTHLSSHMNNINQKNTIHHSKEFVQSVFLPFLDRNKGSTNSQQYSCDINEVILMKIRFSSNLPILEGFTPIERKMPISGCPRGHRFLPQSGWISTRWHACACRNFCRWRCIVRFLAGIRASRSILHSWSIVLWFSITNSGYRVTICEEYFFICQ